MTHLVISGSFTNKNMLTNINETNFQLCPQQQDESAGNYNLILPNYVIWPDVVVHVQPDEQVTVWRGGPTEGETLCHSSHTVIFHM